MDTHRLLHPAGRQPIVVRFPVVHARAWAARAAIGCTAVALAALLSLHVLSPEYSPAWRVVSEYANGQYGWVLSVMFVAYGASSLALAATLRAGAAARRAKLGTALLTVAGAAQAAAAVIDLNVVGLHELLGILGILGLPIAAMLLTPPGTWLRLSAHLTWLSVGVFVATFPVMIATFWLALGSLPTTPPATLPPGVIGLVGWADRLVLLSAWGWVALAAWQHLHAEHTAPRVS
jgi:hypothetical protein